MYRVAHSVNITRITAEEMIAHKNSGIDLIEVSSSYIEECDNSDFDKVAEFAKNAGVELWSFHLPFAPFEEIDISKPELCDYTVEYFKGLIKKAAAIGIDKFVIHPSAEPIEEDERPLRMECAKKSLDILAEFAKEFGAVIAVEDLPRTCLGRNSDDIKELISANEALRVCFDTNHLLTENTADFIHNIGDKIITLHVSDYDKINERHWLPGEGVVDWKELVKALEDIGYNGPWLYEIGYACPWSIKRDRDLTCDDFARNAEEVLSGKEITVFSTKIEGIGMWQQ